MLQNFFDPCNTEINQTEYSEANVNIYLFQNQKRQDLGQPPETSQHQAEENQSVS